MQSTHEKDFRRCEAILAVSLELAKDSWKVALHDGKRERAAVHTIREKPAQARLARVIALLAAAQQQWELGKQARIVVCYEAGQDGFWIARALIARGVEVKVVDPSSIPVERYARRAKTDRLDAIRLVMSLLAWLRGEHGRMKVVRVPEPEQEDRRQLMRERGQLQKEIGQHRDRLRKLLCTQGCWCEVEADFASRLTQGQVLRHDGSPLPIWLRTRLARECVRLALAQQQLKALEAALMTSLPPPVQQRVEQLMRLNGVGRIGATRLVLELFWRRFANRRQVGACVGLVPQPYDSGASRVDQGISKQGNARVRSLLIEMGWLWLRYQPTSALAQWFAQRTQGSGTSKRGKRIAIVAVARRLTIALWRYLEDGVIPAGATMKARELRSQ